MAFGLWTSAAGSWWPMATHSVSLSREATLVTEPRVGGRIYERSPTGEEFEWGRVRLWAPPDRLVYEWLVAEAATELEVRFVAQGDDATVIEIEHRGWEAFGPDGPERREMNNQGWSGVIPEFVSACRERN
jgi:uncharacterized protein YndB with AHSA1/START domain